MVAVIQLRTFLEQFMSFLAAGFLIGMRHALDPDHLSAVAVLVADKPSITTAAQQGAIWGIGHSLALMLVGTLVILADVQISASLAHFFEMLVGLMLIVLGFDCLKRWLQRDQAVSGGHDHQGVKGRALGVGLMHGLAGSSALILLTLSTLHSTALAFSYMGLFGLGSICGMALLSVGLGFSLSKINRLHGSLIGVTRITASVVSIALGGLLLTSSFSAL